MTSAARVLDSQRFALLDTPSLGDLLWRQVDPHHRIRSCSPELTGVEPVAASQIQQRLAANIAQSPKDHRVLTVAVVECHPRHALFVEALGLYLVVLVLDLVVGHGVPPLSYPHYPVAVFLVSCRLAAALTRVSTVIHQAPAFKQQHVAPGVGALRVLLDESVPSVAAMGQRISSGSDRRMGTPKFHRCLFAGRF